MKKAIEQIEMKILRYLGEHNSYATREKIKTRVRGRQKNKLIALRRLLEKGEITRLGRGIKGAPFIYCLPISQRKPEQPLDELVI